MDSHQREPFLDCSNSKFDVLSLLCGQETSPQCSSSLLGSLRPADDQLCGLQDPLDILPGASLDGSDLDPMHEAHDYSAQWEENDHSDLGQYTYCTPSPDSSDSFLACLDHYDSSTPLCPSLSAELDEPTTPSEKCAAAAALEEPGSRLELRQRSRARAKFTQDEDQLIMHLRKKRETWKSIAKKIPGRSPVDWEKGLDEQIEEALRKYEQQQWVFVASQVGTGIGPEACREHALSRLGLSVVRFRRSRE
ncbi:hypothetical protein NQ176_g5617 [Zarea fungicola]|uniref:Uncharacterized protein n=1 Tax=Zarea fungicola TaxID=93591 RepID=A0ACC1N7N0_9HYPO|nr:hypothetical protein NQ176_g5617 [Lecanicillium fungicola]